MDVVLTIHVQLVQLSTQGTSVGRVREETETHSVKKPGALEIKAGLEVRRVHFPRLAICLVEHCFFPSSELSALTSLC